MKRFCFAAIFLVVFAAAPTLLRSETVEPGVSIALSSLAVPEELGKIQERFVGNSPRTIIQIQDVHAHAVAQQNIAAILERLRTTFGIEKIALEGAWNATSLPKSHAIPTSREKQLLAQTLLDDDRISGPVYAAIMSSKPIELVGIEDELFYEKNRDLFLAHLEKSEEIREKLRFYGDSLQEAEKSVWGSELLAFGSAFGSFRETSDLGRFFPVLFKTAETYDVNISDLSQISLVHDIMVQEKLFQKKQLEQEMKHLMREYKNTPWTLEELIRGGKIPPEKLAFYPELKKMLRLYQLRDRISLRDLTIQVEILTRRILEKLVHAPGESALWEKSERFYLAQRILLLQASPADIKTYENSELPVRAELANAGLSEALSLSLDFYAVVKKRDEIFFNRIVTTPALDGNIAIVTGGFHTDGLSQSFRDAGISYITITPELGGASMNEKTYNARMKDNNYRVVKDKKPNIIQHATSGIPGSAQSATLSELRNAIATIDDNFPPALEILKQTRDVRKATARFHGNIVAVSTPDRIAHLSREEKIVPKSGTGIEIHASAFQAGEFMAKPRLEQLETVRGWLAQGLERREKAMLVSSVSILARMLSEEKTAQLLEQAVHNGDVVALAQDVPATQIPEILFSTRGIDRFEAANIETLVEETSRFQRLAKKHPFAIMENGRPSGAYVVLPEKSISLVLFRIITLNPKLYQAAKDPAFLSLLQELVADILSQEIPKTFV